MLLCIDIGNTNIMLGLYEGEELGPHWRIATIHERMPDEFAIQLLALLAHAGIGPEQITGIALASGVPGLTARWSEVCRRYFGLEPVVVNGRMKTGLTILYDNPRLGRCGPCGRCSSRLRILRRPADHRGLRHGHHL
jgi:type III pantothenate kinase